MSLTRDEASNLRSHIEAVVEREKELQRAQAAVKDARFNLDGFLQKQQYPPKL